MRKAAEQVQKAFEKGFKQTGRSVQLSGGRLFKSGELAELKSKEEFMALGPRPSSPEDDGCDRLYQCGEADGRRAGRLMMGGDYGLTLYKVKEMED